MKTIIKTIQTTDLQEFENKLNALQAIGAFATQTHINTLTDGVKHWLEYTAIIWIKN